MDFDDLERPVLECIGLPMPRFRPERANGGRSGKPLHSKGMRKRSKS